MAGPGTCLYIMSPTTACFTLNRLDGAACSQVLLDHENSYKAVVFFKVFHTPHQQLFKATEIAKLDTELCVRRSKRLGPSGGVDAEQVLSARTRSIEEKPATTINRGRRFDIDRSVYWEMHVIIFSHHMIESGACPFRFLSARTTQKLTHAH